MGARVLVLAGFDPSGGAGLLLDTKMLTLLGHQVASIPTALTFQNTRIFESWVPLERDVFEKMLKLTFEDLPIEGVKIGMLGTPEIAGVVAHYLKKYRSQIKWIVLDPVLKATLKRELFQGEDFIRLLRVELLPLVDIITPNLTEAELLTGKRLLNFERDAQLICQELKSFGVKYPIITGFRKKGRILNFLLDEGNRGKFFSVRELPYEFHGTGCALSSLLLGYLLMNYSPSKAIRMAMRKLQTLLVKRASNPLPSGLQLIH